MKRYILGRILRAVLSICVVMSITIILIYTCIPRERILTKDPGLSKFTGDARTNYQYRIWRQAGYLDYLQPSDFCSVSEDPKTCAQGDADYEEIVADYVDRGYTYIEYKESDLGFVTRDYSVPELLINFFTNLVNIDNPWYVQDAQNPDIERNYYITTGPNGLPAVACSGCQYKYQLYFDSNFPFIHQNAVKLEFGISYPTFDGLDTMDVINGGQGELIMTEQTFPTGLTQSSALNQYTCQYKATSTIDHLDQNKFTDNYANCKSNDDAPSMVSTSYLFGIIALVIAYLISIPAGISMARHKDKWQDKIGIAYVNFMIAVPSLAFIYFVKWIGRFFGAPEKFPQLGFGDIRSYILPIIILALLSTSSVMIWMRRYMIDQSNSDYVKFARAKGLSEKEIFNKHILKNAIIPIVNGIPSSIILCISGSVITESVFSIPGMGKMLPDSITALNNKMVITLTFIFASLAIFALLCGDLLMTVVDPRIQLTARKGGKKKK